MNEIMTIQGIPCYEKDGIAYLNLETVARGLGFTKKADSGNEVVNWTRVRGYLSDLGVEQKCTTGDYIPENIFYRLAMKAKNETAERFQAMIADEVVPAIRKHGGYLTPAKVQEVLTDPDTIIQLATQLKESREKAMKLEAINSDLTVQNQIYKPKAEYFDQIVDRNLLTNFRETAKQLGIKERVFVGFLLDHKYIYRDKKGKLMPYAEKNNGLFELKEAVNEKSGWGGTQTLITPKGRETFRLLMQGLAS
jgi:phage antirepressor YoqD-like protein